MKRGKKPGVEKEDVHIYLPSDLVLQLQLKLLDPRRTKMRYGALSLLAERLLRNWLETTGKGTQDESIPQ